MQLHYLISITAILTSSLKSGQQVIVESLGRLKGPSSLRYKSILELLDTIAGPD